MKEAEQHILETLKNWGLVFESHRHNEYVSTFGYLCVRYGINLQEAFDYADSHFSAEYPDTMSVMKSCYRHKERLGTWHFFRKGGVVQGTEQHQDGEAVDSVSIPSAAQPGDWTASNHESIG